MYRSPGLEHCSSRPQHAFGLAALLPSERLKALRLRLILTGLALVGFEIATLYMMQATLVRSSDSKQQSSSIRIAHIEATIQQNRKVSTALVATGMKSGESQFAPSRSEGARALREAAQIEQGNAELSAELAKLQATQVPTLTSTLGEAGMIWCSFTRSVLVVVMGLVMFASAGVLLRACRTQPTAQRVAQEPPTRSVFTHGVEAAPAGVPQGFPTASRWLAATGVTVTEPNTAAVSQAPSSTVTPIPEETVTPESQSSHKNSPKKATVEVGSKRDSGVGPLDGHRYRRIVKAVRAGKLTPSVRAIQAAEGGGTSTVRAYLQEMEREGLIVRDGLGYKKASTRTEP